MLMPPISVFGIFLSTPSARRATSHRPGEPRGPDISIPALREEGDTVRYSPLSRATNFYPRPPRGGRHTSRRHRQHRANFYPRPPRGGRLSVPALGTT